MCCLSAYASTIFPTLLRGNFIGSDEKQPLLSGEGIGTAFLNVLLLQDQPSLTVPAHLGTTFSSMLKAARGNFHDSFMFR